jgi:hypothetical protein
MKLIKVQKPTCELEKSTSPTLHRGAWSVTGYYGTDGNYYEHYKSFDGREKWERLIEEVA